MAYKPLPIHRKHLFNKLFIETIMQIHMNDSCKVAKIYRRGGAQNLYFSNLCEYQIGRFLFTTLSDPSSFRHTRIEQFKSKITRDVVLVSVM